MENRESKQSLIELRLFITTIIILAVLIIAAGAATYLIPAGEFTGSAGDSTAALVYRTIDQPAVPVWKILLSPLLCVTGKNGPKIIVLVLFIFIIGASFSVMNRTGFLPAIVRRLTDSFSDRKTLFLVVNVLFFALLGSTLGIIEEIVPFILFFVPIAYRMGWDSVTGLAIPFLSAGFGFSAATFNPFTLGTAQKLAGLPLFSGLGLRIPLFVITVALVAGYLILYTRKIEKNPELSATYENDMKMKQFMAAEEKPGEFRNLTRIIGYIIFCFLLIVGIVAGGSFVSLLQDLAFPLIALVFLIMGVGVGILSDSTGRDVLRYFMRGLADFAPALIIILMAAAVGYLIEIGKIMDSIIYYFAPFIQQLSKSTAAILLYFLQMMVNFFVPSGSGQAVLTIPILAPLSDFAGLSRQTLVMAFHCGDGFSNLLWPTNPMLMVAIGLAAVSYRDWFRWVIKLHVIIAAVSCAFLLLAVHINYI